MYGPSDPVPISQPIAAIFGATNPASKGITPGHAKNAQAARTNTAFALNRNPMPAATPLQKNCRREASAFSTAARCGARSSTDLPPTAIPRSAYRMSKRIPAAPPPHTPRAGFLCGTHRPAANAYASTQQRNAYRAPATRNTGPIRRSPQQVDGGDQRRFIEPDIAVKHAAVQHPQRRRERKVFLRPQHAGVAEVRGEQ